MPVDPRTPCVIGVARRTWRDDPLATPEPLRQWARVAREAAADAGGTGVLDAVDAVFQVHCASWTYDDGPGRLADLLGIHPAHTRVSILAGTAGQRMVNAAAERMLAGRSEVALVVGGEALATVRAHREAGEEPPWSHPAPERDPGLDLDEWFWPTEWAHGVLQPTVTFAAMDTARRARREVDPDAYRLASADLLSRCTSVAAADPGAWFPTERPAREIATPGPANRWVATPYTKYMNAVMDVDMAAAVVVATHGAADRLGVPSDRRVYLRGWSFARDATHVAERPFLDRSPAMAEVSADALGRAGVSVDDLTRLDLYSCFPLALHAALDALGLPDDDPRGVTVTGGLPYHGGPSSNYTTHAVAAMVERLRGDGDGHGLVTGVGMHLAKHTWAVYSPTPGPVAPPDYDAVQAAVDAHGAPVPVARRLDAATDATVACWSVVHGRDGVPERALVVAELDDGRRVYGSATRPDTLAALAVGEWVGRRVRLEPADEAGAHVVTV